MGDEGEFNRLVLLLRDIPEKLGEIRGKLGEMDQHLQSIDRRLELGSSQMHQQGTAIATQAIQLESLERKFAETELVTQQRRRRCSELLRGLGARLEDTGVFVIQSRTIDETRKRWFSTVMKVIALIATVAGVFGAGTYIERCSLHGAASKLDGGRK